MADQVTWHLLDPGKLYLSGENEVARSAENPVKQYGSRPYTWSPLEWRARAYSVESFTGPGFLRFTAPKYILPSNYALAPWVRIGLIRKNLAATRQIPDYAFQFGPLFGGGFVGGNEHFNLLVKG